jgi:hypothetical protein
MSPDRLLGTIFGTVLPGTAKQYSVKKVLYGTLLTQRLKTGNARDGYICRGVATKNEYNTVELEQYYGYT